jgi:hypothetical protein
MSDVCDGPPFSNFSAHLNRHRLRCQHRDGRRLHQTFITICMVYTVHQPRPLMLYAVCMNESQHPPFDRTKHDDHDPEVATALWSKPEVLRVTSRVMARCRLFSAALHSLCTSTQYPTSLCTLNATMALAHQSFNQSLTQDATALAYPRDTDLRRGMVAV